MINISSAEVTIISRVFVAVLLGVLIGFQREKKKIVDKTQGSAGLRTHALVCMGAALVVAVASTTNLANSIIGLASIMTGIGFIGAGSFSIGYLFLFSLKIRKFT